VVVEHGGGGSKTAAPIARDILLEAQRRKAARPGIGDHIAATGEPASGSLGRADDLDEAG
jgi:penicillin-binding protein 2